MELKIFDIGLVDFKESEVFQKEVFTDVKNGSLKSAVILCQHHPVITLGRQADKKNILISEDELGSKGIKIYETGRGGDVTYHGPGQVVIYPIFNLNYFKKDIHIFLRYLEALTIQLLNEFGILGERKSGLTGVWVGDKKIASIGIAIKNWLTFHGLAINVKEEDLDNFSLIRPCGMDIIMTSIESVLKRRILIEEVKEILIKRWKCYRGHVTEVSTSRNPFIFKHLLR